MSLLKYSLGPSVAAMGEEHTWGSWARRKVIIVGAGMEILSHTPVQHIEIIERNLFWLNLYGISDEVRILPS